MKNLSIKSNKSYRKFSLHNIRCLLIIFGSTISQRDFPNIFKRYINRLFWIDDSAWEQPFDGVENEVGWN